jgi:EAL domain-containing protein (putative c-di-GMP-specific phosphodiesterase class I)
MRQWRDEGLTVPSIAVNLSIVELKTGDDFVRDVAQTIAKWGLDPADIEFDVTEATLARLTWAQNGVLPKLHELGVRIAIDDFGSEYSSFEYIRAYHINHVKIAQSFIRKSTHDPESAATIHAIVNFANDVGIGVIAQGVETEQQRALLAASDSTAQAQGFRFSKAVGAARAGELLRLGHVALNPENGSVRDETTSCAALQDATPSA